MPRSHEMSSGPMRVEHLRQQVADRAARRGERSELQRSRGEQVAPPARVQGHLRERADAELRRDRQAVADVTQANAPHGCVDREDESVVARLLGALHESLG
jgi:hypothetical protein